MSENAGHEGGETDQTSIGDVRRATHAAVGRFRDGVLGPVQSAAQKAQQAHELAVGAKAKLDEALGMIAAASALGNEAEAELRATQAVGQEVAGTLTDTVGGSSNPQLRDAGAAAGRFTEGLVDGDSDYVTARTERDAIAAAYPPLSAALDGFAGALAVASEALSDDHGLGVELADNIDEQVDKL